MSVADRPSMERGRWRVFATVFLVVSMSALGNEQSTQQELSPSPVNRIEGTWQGVIHVQDASLRAVVRITHTANALTATIYMIDQRGQPIDANTVSFKNGTLQFSNQFLHLAYDGRMSSDGNSISGTITQNGSFPLVLERATPDTEWAIPTPPAKLSAMAEDVEPGVEVATIRPTPPDAPRTLITFRGDEIVVERMTLMNLIEYAYDVHEKQVVGGPRWMGVEQFDINLKPDQPGSPSAKQFRTILKKLLTDRFALHFHNEQRKMEAYVLTVSKGGPKMAKSQDQSMKGRYSEGPGGLIRMRNSTTENLATLLQSTVMDRPVLNHTDLEGEWDFELRWLPDESQFGGQLTPSPADASATNEPPLFTAISEQLGLRLEPERAAVEIMVVDHVEHPSPN